MSAREWTTALSLQRTGDLWRGWQAYAGDFMRPTLRIGVTGLARSGKTIFITSLIHNLVHSGRLPFFAAHAQGRIVRAYLEPQPDDAVPRFDYEGHLSALTGEDPHWPSSTRRISQLRLTIEFQSNEFLKRNFGQNQLSIDIVDYPGEWLLDLPLLNLSYDEWSRQALELATAPERQEISGEWIQYLRSLRENLKDDEAKAQEAARLFAVYLKRCREDDLSFSTVPPGRFLMPGDLEGSPALTFSPLLPPDSHDDPDPLRAMMERRFEAYKSHVVKPFFQNHFARLDRQIVLVDALQALNAGPPALRDLERALVDILNCFRPGRNSWLSSILGRRIDRILFAATKADHLHHKSHDRLEAILEAITRQAVDRASFSGAKVKVLAMACLRATREAQFEQNGEALPCIMGVPLAGEQLTGQVFDGAQEIAIFPGDLPGDPELALAEGRAKAPPGEEEMRFIRFRPPSVPTGFGGTAAAALPHIRLDRAIDFLIGDYLS